MSKRRSRKFVDNEVQANLVVRLCVHWLFFLCATSLAMYFWVRFIESPADTPTETFNKFLSNFIPLLIVAMALLPVFILDAVKLSNRFTGPIFRLRQTLSRLAEGKPVRPLSFRSSDFWQTLAEDFNRVVPLTPTTAANAPTAEVPTPS